MNNNVNMHYLLFRLMYIRPLMSVYFQTTIKFRFSFLAECYSLNSTICATFIIFAYFKLHDLFINRHKEMHKVDYQDYKFLNRSEMTCTIVDDWVMGTDIYVLSTVNQGWVKPNPVQFFRIWYLRFGFFEGVQFIIRF